jgi:hypothetical protein
MKTLQNILTEINKPITSKFDVYGGVEGPYGKSIKLFLNSTPIVRAFRIVGTRADELANAGKIVDLKNDVRFPRDSNTSNNIIIQAVNSAFGYLVPNRLTKTTIFATSKYPYSNINKLDARHDEYGLGFCIIIPNDARVWTCGEDDSIDLIQNVFDAGGEDIVYGMVDEFILDFNDESSYKNIPIEKLRKQCGVWLINERELHAYVMFGKLLSHLNITQMEVQVKQLHSLTHLFSEYKDTMIVKWIHDKVVENYISHWHEISIEDIANVSYEEIMISTKQYIVLPKSIKGPRAKHMGRN